MFEIREMKQHEKGNFTLVEESDNGLRESDQQSTNDAATTLSPNSQTQNEEPCVDNEADVPVTRAAMIYVLCAALNSCSLGYDIGVSTNVSKLIQNDLQISDTQREIWIGLINFWAIFGALSAQYFSDQYGRRTTFFVAASGFIVGTSIMAAASTYITLIVGRTLIGVGVGVGLAIDPLYIAEIVPARHRGRLVTYSEIALNIGIVMGFSSGLVFTSMKDNLQWRCMLAIGTLLPIVMIALLLLGVMPESPRWLVSKNRDNEAHRILQKIYPPTYDINQIVNTIRESITREQIMEQHAAGWYKIFRPTPAIRRMLFVGVGTAVAQQAVGIDAIQYYLVDVIERLGISSDTYQSSVILISLGMIKLIMLVVGGKLFDHYGRRPLFFISLIGMSLALLSISIVFFFEASSVSTAANITVLVGLALYLSFFSLGIGPGGWLIPSEVFSMSIRGKAMSIATVCNRVTSTMMSSTFLTTVSLIGWSGFFFLLFLVCVIVLAFVYNFLPETKGESLEKIAALFAKITRDPSILQLESTVEDSTLRGRSERGVGSPHPVV